MTTTLLAVESLAQAVDVLAQTFDSYVAYDVGPRLTCSELDSLATVFAVAGHTHVAETWVMAHGAEDEVEDRHEDIAAAFAKGDDDGAEVLVREYVATLAAIPGEVVA